MTIRAGFVLTFAGFVVGTFEATASSFFPSPWRFVHPVLPVVASLIVLEKRSWALLFGFTAGMAMDALAVGTASLASARLILIVLAVSYMARRFLTNHSIFAAVAVVFIARGFEWFWLFLLERILSIAGEPFRFAPGWGFVWPVMAWDAFFIGLSFIAAAFVRTRFVGLAPTRRISRI